MSVVRLKAAIEAIRGDTITNAHALRIGGNLYVLTSENPDPSLTNDQKAAIILNFVRLHMRALARDGAAKKKKEDQVQANIDEINAAADAAAGDV